MPLPSNHQARILLSRAFAALVFLLILVTRSVHRGTIAGELLSFAGLLLVTIAVVGRLWCSLYISGYKNTELITAGPYSLTRNPLYFFSFLGFVGVACTTQTFSLVAVITLAFGLGYPVTIRNEEIFLRQKFGKAFDDFCARTPRFFPNFRNYLEPDTWVVYPGRFRRTPRDVVWFIWLVAIVELVLSIKQDAGSPALLVLF
ncbi:methyltransferase family protein [Variovorax sp. ZT5P49]|uniref:methyltransferase family protein n=1 Tax=Variovorax sp. ZT5P49 TaxID=3443733 RepID=UPI003F44E63A